MGVRTADGDVGLRAEMACLGQTDLPDVDGIAASAAGAGFAAGRSVAVEMTGAVPVAAVVRRGQSHVGKGRTGIARTGLLRAPDSPPGSRVGSRQRRYKRTSEGGKNQDKIKMVFCWPEKGRGGGERKVVQGLEGKKSIKNGED